jgi:hypothetical protein
MESAIADSADVMSNSLAIVDSAGAMIVDTIMRLKPVAERTSVTAHLLLFGQSFGFSASNGSANATRNGSFCLVFVFGIGSSSIGGAIVIVSLVSWSGL